MVDFRACGQSVKEFRSKMGLNDETHVMAECSRRPMDGVFEPKVKISHCDEWKRTEFGYMLKNMRVMILGLDGYLGWTLALHLSKLGFKISGVDNFARRGWTKKAGSVVPIQSMKTRLRVAKETLGIDIKFKKLDILKDKEKLRRFIEEEKPEAIVHYGECPSAPFSMMNVDNALYVQENNVLGTLSLLFGMRNTVPESSLIKLGTMGELGQPLTGRPLFEGLFPGDAVLKWRGKEWSLAGEMIPRDPGSFYHLSKVHDSYNVLEACKYWWLRSIDVMQGVIYGVDTPQLRQDERLRTRFDIDETFGTVVNRFVAQAIAGIPLTLYGTGNQIRGLIALKDAMECMTRLILHPPEPGQYSVVNQISGFYNLRELAETVRNVGSRFNLNVKIQRVENPRVESEQHPFNPVCENLRDIYGFEPQTTLHDEIFEIFNLLTNKEIKNRIDDMKEFIIPQTRWSGEHQKSRTLEMIK